MRWCAGVSDGNTFAMRWETVVSGAGSGTESAGLAAGSERETVMALRWAGRKLVHPANGYRCKQIYTQ